MAVSTIKRGKENSPLYEHICDTLSDMTNITTEQITLGSVCSVLAGTSGGMDLYIANSQHEWLFLASMPEDATIDRITAFMEYAEKVFEELPEDYTDLDNDVTNLKNLVEQGQTASGAIRTGGTISGNGGKHIRGLKLFAHAEFSSLTPTMSSPATISQSYTGKDILFYLTKGFDHGIEDFSLERTNSRTNTITLKSPLPAGYHSIHLNIQSNSVDGVTTFTFRDSSNADLTSVVVAAGKTGAVVSNITLNSAAAKLYAFISNNASSGTIVVKDVIIDGVMAMTYDTGYSVPVETGGNFSYDGIQHLCDYIDFAAGKIKQHVSRRYMANVSNTYGTLNTLSGNTLYNLNSNYTNGLIASRQANYFCTHFTPNTTGYDDSSVGMYFWNGSFRFRVPDADFADSAALDQWMKSNGVAIFLPRDTVSETDLTARQKGVFANIIQYEANDLITCSEDVGFEITFEEQDITNSITLGNGVITPEAFGAVGDGVADDTYAVQAAINAAEKINGTLTCSGGAVYKVKTLMVNGAMNLNGNGCTFKGSSTQPVFNVYRTANSPNGSMHDFTVDMNHTAINGILVYSDWRCQYHHLTIMNPATNGIGINIWLHAGGCLFDSINGRDAIGSTTHGTTFIYVRTADASFSNIDWQNYCVGIDVRSAATFKNIHGYIALDDIFEESVFMRIAGRVSVVNAYPDTQAKFFEIQSNHAVSIIGGYSWYNGDVVNLANHPQGYAFYTDNADYFKNVLADGFNFTQPENGAKPYMLSNQATKPRLIGCFQEGESVFDLDDIHELKNALENDYAKIDGSYQYFTAGNAEQLLSDKGVTDNTPYLFRPSAGNGANREQDVIIGDTVNWNQMCNNGNFASTTGWSTNNATLTATNNIGSLTASASGGFTSHPTYYVSGHVTLTSMWVMVDSGSARIMAWTASAQQKNTSLTGVYENVNIMFKPTATGSNSFPRIADYRTTRTEIKIKNVQIFDLTAMFGTTIADYIYSLESATAGAGVALFRSLFQKPYYAYNVGELMSVQAAAHLMVGFNQWDEEWEVGGISGVNGQNVSTTGTIRSKNYVPVFPGMTYYFKSPVNCWWHSYDAGKNYLGVINYGSSFKNETKTLGASVHYLRFQGNAYGNAYNHDICVNISCSKNGTYEPYTKNTYPLSPITLRGIPKLDNNNKLYYDGDTYQSNGTVTRKYNEFTISVDSIYVRSENQNCDFAIFKTPSAWANISPKPIFGEKIFVVDKGWDTATETGTIIVYNSATLQLAAAVPKGTTLSQAQALFDGTKAIYGVATPTTETAIPFQSPQIVDAFGTEEYIDAGMAAGTRDVAIPVGHDTYYPENVSKKIAGLPWDFSTLIATTEKSFKATKTYNVNDFLIVDNQLYKVTASIANGGTITPNTNVIATTIGAQLTALLNA